MRKLFKRLVAAGPDRVTRLHDADRHLIPFGRLLRNGPRAAVSTLGRLAFGHRPSRPWISYDAQSALERLLTSEARVLEFGSGMSTAWFAERSGEIVAVENDDSWARKVEEICARRGLTNVKLRVARVEKDYVTLPPELRAGGFDLVVIDGRWREACVPTAIDAVKSDGSIYLDNSDMDRQPCKPLLEWAQRTDREIVRFTDFAPTLLFVSQGLLFTPKRRPPDDRKRDHT